MMLKQKRVENEYVDKLLKCLNSEEKNIFQILLIAQRDWAIILIDLNSYVHLMNTILKNEAKANIT